MNLPFGQTKNGKEEARESEKKTVERFISIKSKHRQKTSFHFLRCPKKKHVE